MASDPALIQSIFLSKSEGKSQGFYSVALCKNGVFSEIVVDDNFPKLKNKLQLCSSDKDSSCLWPLIAEKAYAKLYGSYAYIGVEGFSSNAIYDFTGAPCLIIDLKELSRTAEGGDVAGALKAKINEIGSKILVGRHHNEGSFTILDVSGDTVVLRDPEGDNAAILENSKSMNNGAMKMAITEFAAQFDALTIGLYNPKAVLTQKAVPKKSVCLENLSCFELSVSAGGTYWVSWHRADKRCVLGYPNPIRRTRITKMGLGGSMEGLEVIGLDERSNLIIFDQEGQLIGQSCSLYRDLSLKVTLKEGAKYFAYVRKIKFFDTF